ncbi:hypothetical protein J1605_007082 [Eschrichtius robustus]|uniref:Uncharacterized protein n=1 Tax=Eschrichtius robustus TaxID=9764 RepID=A0AB34H3K7_ESCRO|nr:hypothetical protein J1605_007082 [Eschrichtius robustus]
MADGESGTCTGRTTSLPACVRVDAASFLARSSFLLSGREGALRWVWLKEIFPRSRVSCACAISSSRGLTRLGVGCKFSCALTKRMGD